MTEEEVKSVVEKLKQDGMSEGDIIGSMWKMAQSGKITIDQFGALIDTMGYHVNPDLKKMPDDKAKELDWEFDEAPKKLPENKQEAENNDDADKKKALELMGYKD